ncbi:unnamed protein product [Angiostrongylus costaricensis]|uniref:PlsC domain-containing protein n=1 Tax=Angiostrongylus costaricensis TaxID=334426 RepID=A0A0R3PCQ8_ANGCS|nr:unnamed protein product [Angiostrongylus costaricensis]
MLGSGAVFEQTFRFLYVFLLLPILLVILLAILLAVSGKSFGLREQYVDALIRIFEAGLTRIIHKETEITLKDADSTDPFHEVVVESRGWAAIRDSIDFIKVIAAGIESVIEDEVTSRFEAEQLVSWNMLTRTSIRSYHFVNWKLSILWVLGFLLRYCLMLPFRFILFSIGVVLLLVSTATIGLVPDGKLKNCMLLCCRILSQSLTAVVKFYDVHNRARNGGICVSNHTSPIDVVLLSTDNVYALVGQQHFGALGLIQRALSRASRHIWFERTEANDRRLVTAILREHCRSSTNLPILIFPEGTCINNTSVMMFKKGSFEVSTKIYPIAMKYDSRFGDPFWNSSSQSWCEYMFRMMTSWAILCNVYYLAPMEKLVLISNFQPDEDATAFASRVKKSIAFRGGLLDLEWDGGLKRTRVHPKLVAKQQER